MANSRYEELLLKLLNDEPLDHFEPQCRTEAYLKACIECRCEGVPNPQTRSDALLLALAEKMEEGATPDYYEGEVEEWQQ